MTPDGDTQMARTAGSSPGRPDRSAQGSAQEAVGGFERRQGGHALEAAQENRRVHGPFGGPPEVQIAGEQVAPAAPPGATGECRASQRAHAEGGQFGQVARQRLRRCGRRAGFGTVTGRDGQPRGARGTNPDGRGPDRRTACRRPSPDRG